MRPWITLLFGFGAIGVCSTQPGCAAPALYSPLPLPDHSALDSKVQLPAERRKLTSTPSHVVLASATSSSSPQLPQESKSSSTPAPGATGALTPAEAVRFALESNPSLQAFRELRGFAQGGLVIARTYPYNPVSQLQFFGVRGEGVTNNVTQAHKITLDIEVRGQRGFRKQAAFAALTRTEWDIATQELLIAVAANRAYNTVLYRQRKLEVLEDTIKLNTQVVEQVKKLVDLGRLRAADLIVAQTELDTATAQCGQGRTAVAFARSDLRRQFGTLDDTFTVTGELDLPLPTTSFEALTEAALLKRPDLQSRKLSVVEAQAKLNLQVADRYGNPNFGPSFDFNENNNGFYGFQLGGPLPMFNQKSGEILQARAMVAQAAATVRQFEIQSAQDVQAALLRLDAAQKWAKRYSGEVLPNLLKSLQDMKKLLDQNEPGVDVLKVIGVQRNYLTAYSAYLDALYEVSQARADLAAAVGDIALALGLYAPSKQEKSPESPILLDPKSNTSPAPLPKSVKDTP